MGPSLYVHIPFCLKRCLYCDFVSLTYSLELAESYVEALLRELRCLKPPDPFSTLYIGGGTPTVLPEQQLSRLLDSIFSRFPFAERYEATIEANPGTLTPQKISVLRSAGLNRISMGVQSFHDQELLSLGRIHTAREASEAVRMARDCGMDNTGIDLMYGIPLQTMESWKMTLDEACSLNVDHISTYELSLEKGTGLAQQMDGTLGQHASATAAGKVSMMNEEEIIAMYTYALDTLRREGFEHYEISNFARPGFACLHNLNYWQRGEYHGVGLGAHSLVKEHRFANTTDMAAYLAAPANRDRMIRDSHPLSRDTALSEAIFLGLRRRQGISLPSLSQAFGIDLTSSYREELESLSAARLIELDKLSGSVKLTTKGILLSNEVFAKFL